MIRGAVLSADGRYRYALTRRWGSRRSERDLVFIGVNPSLADHYVDDATVRRWTGFAGRWDFTGFTAVNLFAWIASDVAELAVAHARGEDPVGSTTRARLLEAVGHAQLIVPCWGSALKLPGSLRPHLTETAALLRDVERRRHGRFKAFGYTVSGDPTHPLMLPYATALVPWPQPKE